MDGNFWRVDTGRVGWPFPVDRKGESCTSGSFPPEHVSRSQTVHLPTGSTSVTRAFQYSFRASNPNNPKNIKAHKIKRKRDISRAMASGLSILHKTAGIWSTREKS